jgi:hypothetical protein
MEKRLKKINGVSFRRHRNKNSAKVILTIDIPLKLIYEKEELWKNGKKIENKEFGKCLPDCCKPLPKKNAIYLCKCEKHIVRITRIKNHRASKSIIIQIGEIPEKISHHYLCKHLCK